MELMEYTAGRLDDERIETKKLIVFIGDDRYRLSESVDGKLTINKMSDGDTDDIRIHPRYSNEIEIS